jgi:hypothetical protein
VREPAAPDEPLNRLSMTVLMTPDMSNFSGNVHGGLLLKLLDQVAYTCASRCAAPTPSRCRWTRWCPASRCTSVSWSPSPPA